MHSLCTAADVVLRMALGNRGAASTTVDVHFVSERQMASLNASYTGKRKATDVLAFPSAEPAGVAPSFLGDLFVCPANIEARLRCRPYEHLDHDTYFLVAYVHGLLHLCGYRHESDADHAMMRAMEQRCARRLITLHRVDGLLPKLLCPRVDIKQ